MIPSTYTTLSGSTLLSCLTELRPHIPCLLLPDITGFFIHNFPSISTQDTRPYSGSSSNSSTFKAETAQCPPQGY